MAASRSRFSRSRPPRRFLPSRACRPISSLLETGLGGRLDATNVIRRPAATAITPISLDHQAFLGDTIAAIAGEKAGILKPGVPAVIGPQPAEAAAVIEARAAAIGAPLYRWDHEWRCHTLCDPALQPAPASGGGRVGVAQTGMRYEGEKWRLDLPPPSLPGAHQIANAGIALACLEQLHGFSPPADAIATGTAPNRLAGAAAASDARPACRNPAAALGVVARRRPQPRGRTSRWPKWPRKWRDRPLYLVLGMLNTKDAGGFLAPLASHARALYALTIPGEENAVAGPAIAARRARLGIAAEECGRSRPRCSAIIAARDGPARVLICGSLHLAGIVLADNG